MDNNLVIRDKTELLKLFETEEDRRGNDLLAMSNFFELLISKSDSYALHKGKWEETADYSSMLGQIATAIKSGFDISNMKMLVADSSHFNKEIIDGLKSGLYHVGESKEVAGNLRPAILDKNEKLVKFFTLKKAINPTEILSDMTNVTMQLSLKHISEQIDAVSRDVHDIYRFMRREALYVPFVNARGKIIKAATSQEKQEKYLDEADTYLMEGLNSLYSDLEDELKMLSSISEAFLSGAFGNIDEVDSILSKINEDMQLIPRYVGLRAYLLYLQDDRDNAYDVIDTYRYNLEMLASNKVGASQKYTALELIHRYYPYSERNLDYWVEKPVKVIESLKWYEGCIEKQPQDVYYIDMEACA